MTQEPVMKSLSISKESLRVTALLFYHFRVNRERCEEALNDEVFATEKVYELVKIRYPLQGSIPANRKEFLIGKGLTSIR